jgi:hypothetical protein
VGGSTACGATPGWAPATVSPWAWATPNPKSKKQIEAVSLVFMAPPQYQTIVLLNLFYDKSRASRYMTV